MRCLICWMVAAPEAGEDVEGHHEGEDDKGTFEANAVKEEAEGGGYDGTADAGCKGDEAVDGCGFASCIFVREVENVRVDSAAAEPESRDEDKGKCLLCKCRQEEKKRCCAERGKDDEVLVVPRKDAGQNTRWDHHEPEDRNCYVANTRLKLRRHVVIQEETDAIFGADIDEHDEAEHENALRIDFPSGFSGLWRYVACRYRLLLPHGKICDAKEHEECSRNDEIDEDRHLPAERGSSGEADDIGCDKRAGRIHGGNEPGLRPAGHRVGILHRGDCDVLDDARREAHEENSNGKHHGAT